MPKAHIERNQTKRKGMHAPKTANKDHFTPKGVVVTNKPTLGPIDPATFGILVARYIKEHPWSSNWALVAYALENTEHELDHVTSVKDIIDHVAAQETPK